LAGCVSVVLVDSFLWAFYLFVMKKVLTTICLPNDFFIQRVLYVDKNVLMFTCFCGLSSSVVWQTVISAEVITSCVLSHNWIPRFGFRCKKVN
jgi:hypothetical protein